MPFSFAVAACVVTLACFSRYLGVGARRLGPLGVGRRVGDTGGGWGGSGLRWG